MENEKFSHWEIERLLRGDLSEREAESLRARISASPELSRYFASMRNEAPARTFADLREKAARADGAQRPAAAPARSAQGERNTWAEWVARLFRGTGPRLAFGAALVLLIGVSIRTLLPSPEPGSGAYAAKGDEGFEVMLRIGGADLEPDVTRTVSGADTVRVLYRGTQARFVQLWYQEDDGAAAPFPGSGDEAAPWPGSSKWSLAPKKILLAGEWARQSIFVVSSDRALSPSQVGAAISAVSPRNPSIQVAHFRLKRKPK
jgi:hypothetical protein